MLLRGVCVRRSFYSKLILLGIVAICILFYFKYVTEIELKSSSSSSVVNNGISANEKIISFIENSRFVNKFDKLIQLDLAKQVAKLGDNGKSVTLTGEAKEIGDKQLTVIALNEELSEHLSYNRTTPDARNPLCKKHEYDLNALPTTSVVIIFYNEPYSVLVRTIHSVLNTCDKRILKEIILVDDCSTNVELHDKLDYYMETRLPRDTVKIIRLKSR